MYHGTHKSCIVDSVLLKFVFVELCIKYSGISQNTEQDCSCNRTGNLVIAIAIIN